MMTCPKCHQLIQRKVQDSEDGPLRDRLMRQGSQFGWCTCPKASAAREEASTYAEAMMERDLADRARHV